MFNEAQQLINKYDDLLDNFKELTDEQIDELLWSEADLHDLINQLIPINVKLQYEKNH